MERESGRHRYEPRYDLAETETYRRIGTLLETRRPHVEDRLICYEIDDSNPNDRQYTDVARTVEGNVFFDSFQNTPEDMRKLYGEADEARRSIFFLVVDQQEKRPAGVLRMIREQVGSEGQSALPTLKALETMYQGVDGMEDAAELYKDPVHYNQILRDYYNISDPARCWDIATAAVPTDYRTTGASALAYRAGLKAAKKAGARDFFAIIDETALRGMTKLGFPFHALPVTNWVAFEGSDDSLPVHGYVDEFENAILDKEQEMIAEGKGGVASRMAFKIIGAGARDDAIIPSQDGTHDYAA